MKKETVVVVGPQSYVVRHLLGTNGAGRILAADAVKKRAAGTATIVVTETVELLAQRAALWNESCCGSSLPRVKDGDERIHPDFIGDSTNLVAGTLTDYFGIAKAARRNNDEVTVIGFGLGRAASMANELIRAGAKVTLDLNAVALARGEDVNLLEILLDERVQINISAD